MASHDSPKTLRGEGKKLADAEIAAVTKLYDPAPYPNHPSMPKGSK